MPDAVAALEVDAAIAAEPASEPSPAGVETDMRAARMDDSAETLVDEPLADDVASEFLTPAFEAHEEACAPVMAEPAPAEEIVAEEETQLPFPEAASEETHAAYGDGGETATVSLNDEVDQSLARLRDALDLLTRELSSGVEPQADDGADVRLAG